jgi:hypothetical protein
MRSRRRAWPTFLLFLALAPLAACSPEGVGVSARTFPAGTAWPQTVEGVLDIAVEEGEAGADEISEINFGTVQTASGTVLIDVEGAVVRRAGLTREDLYRSLAVRATLSGPSAYAGPGNPSYRVTSLERGR